MKTIKGLLCLFLVLAICKVNFSQTATAPSGSGTALDPYQIATLNNLYWLTQNSAEWDKSYIQTANIDATSTSSWDDGDGGSAEGLSPIGTSSSPAFTGTYDGQGYVISSLYISRTATNNVGLFGYTTGATIENLGVTSVSINGQNNVGSIVGYNHSTIINNCYATGGIGGDLICGGLIGANYNSSSVNRCYADVNVHAENLAGGFIGSHNNSTIENCYSLGDVQCTVEGGTPSELAGFSGNQGNNSDTKIEYCYSIGMVSYLLTEDPTTKGFLGVNNSGTCTANFWDTQTSGQSSSGAASIATGKTTADMKTASTFTNAGWNTSIWNIGDGINNDYPYLDWQNSGGTPLPIELVSFTAASTNAGIVLSWTTATEINNYGFEILRSNLRGLEDDNDDSNLEGYTTIGFVQGHGNSNSPKTYEFVDDLNLDLYPDLTLKYRLKQIDTDGSYTYYSTIAEVNNGITEVEENSLPTKFSLSQNYPNPFNPATTIAYNIPVVDALSSVEGQHVTLKIYDILGNEVVTLVNEQKAPGRYQVKFGAKDLGSGIYFYQLKAGRFFETKKMILIK